MRRDILLCVQIESSNRETQPASEIGVGLAQRPCLPSQVRASAFVLADDSWKRWRNGVTLPTVDHVTAEPVPDFEIVSWQTNDAKGDMPPEEFIAYCRRVVQVADQQGSDRR